MSMYVCPTCKKEFQEALKYTMHREIHFWTDEPDEDASVCSHCGGEMFHHTVECAWGTR